MNLENEFVDKLKINYVVSFGDCCITAWFMKHNGLKKCSYPFDWIVTGELCNLIDCIDTDFEKFLDKSRYIDSESPNSNGAGHLDYHKNMFIHRDPRIEKHHNYYVRSINRFRKLLNKAGSKLFIYTTQETDEDLLKIEVDSLNQILSKKTTNYYILLIQLKLGDKRNKNIKVDGNVIHLNLTTTTPHNGLHFENKKDTKLYVNGILELFEFDLPETNYQ